jgi:hypothetical protein
MVTAEIGTVLLLVKTYRKPFASLPTPMDTVAARKVDPGANTNKNDKKIFRVSGIKLNLVWTLQIRLPLLLNKESQPLKKLGQNRFTV